MIVLFTGIYGLLVEQASRRGDLLSLKFYLMGIKDTQHYNEIVSTVFSEAFSHRKTNVLRWLFKKYPSFDWISEIEALSFTVRNPEEMLYLYNLFSREEGLTMVKYMFLKQCKNIHPNSEWIELCLDTFPELTITDEEFCLLCKHSMINKSTYYTKQLKTIYLKRPDINIEHNDHEIFRYAALNNNISLCLWLESINAKYSVETNLSSWNRYHYTMQNIVSNHEYKIISFKIKDVFNDDFVSKENKETCVICYEKTEELNPQCGHSFCSICLMKSMKTSCLCPFCRQIIRSVKKVK